MNFLVGIFFSFTVRFFQKSSYSALDLSNGCSSIAYIFLLYSSKSDIPFPLIDRPHSF